MHQHAEPIIALLHAPAWYRRPGNLTGAIFAAAGTVLLVTQHRSFFSDAWPYLLFLLCPLVHLFGHGGHSSQPPGVAADKDHR